MTRACIASFSALSLLMAATQAEASVRIVQHYAVGTMSPGGLSGSVVARCSAGEVPIGGGFDATSGQVFTYANLPSGPNSAAFDHWTVKAKNYSSSTQNVYSFITCAAGDSNASSYRVDVFKEVGPGGMGDAAPGCGRGYLSAGGYRSYEDDSHFVPYYFSAMRGDNQRWETAFWNFGGDSERFRAYAVCVENLDADFDREMAWSSFSLSPDQDKAFTGNCRSGYSTVVGSGFWFDAPSSRRWVYGSRSNYSNVLVRVHNGDPYSTMYPQIAAKCVSPW